jgi:hypothetical protein
MDLRKQFKDVLNKYGHKVIYRRYDVGNLSDNYSPTTREGVGGSRWQYEDEVVLCRHSPASLRGTKGQFEGKTVYYFDNNVKPKVNDVIIEVYGDTSSATPDSEVTMMPFKHSLRIVDVEVKRGFNGETVFYTVYTEPEYGYY